MVFTPQNPSAIEVCNLVKRYPKGAANAVDNVSFTVQCGEIFGLLGPKWCREDDHNWRLNHQRHSHRWYCSYYEY